MSKRRTKLHQELQERKTARKVELEQQPGELRAFIFGAYEDWESEEVVVIAESEFEARKILQAAAKKEDIIMDLVGFELKTVAKLIHGVLTKNHHII